MLFVACFWCLINFRFISNAFSLFFSFPLLSCYSFSIPFSNLCILLLSSLPLQSTQIFIKIGFLNNTIESIGQSLSCGLLFIILQLKEFLYSYFSLSDCLIGSIFYFTTGLHGIHVLIGSFLFFLILFYLLFDQSLYFMEFSFSLFLSSYY
jgi:heme/copper-type cytochrome/quinol oxidase subunit 3